MKRVLKRKTNDEEVRIGDTIYDRMGKRYKLMDVGGERLIRGQHIRRESIVMTGNADHWGLYFDPPYPKDAKQIQREQRAYWMDRAKSYLDMEDY